jgi:hypothetical protein
MVTTELAIQVALLVVCIVAAFVLFIVALMLGMAYVGDGSDKSAASAKERWEDRLIVVGAILVAIVIGEGLQQARSHELLRHRVQLGVVVSHAVQGSGLAVYSSAGRNSKVAAIESLLVRSLKRVLGARWR